MGQCPYVAANDFVRCVLNSCSYSTYEVFTAVLLVASASVIATGAYTHTHTKKQHTCFPHNCTGRKIVTHKLKMATPSKLDSNNICKM